MGSLINHGGNLWRSFGVIGDMIRCIERLTGLLLLVLVLLASTPRPVDACSCAGSPSVPQAKDAATAVFAGTVTTAPGGFGGVFGLGDSVTFRVERSWKGVDTELSLIHI